MKRDIIAVGYLVLMGIVIVQLAACSPEKAAQAAGQPAIENVPVAPQVVAPSFVAGPSCAAPAPEMVGGCRAQAERVLASTVRLELHGPGGGIGHATVVGGRYLITHNHYPSSGDALRRGGDGLVDAVSILKWNGDIVLLKAPLTYFTVVAVEPETLVLDFQAYGGVGFFDSLGIPSAEVGDSSNALNPGDEVAQIDWNGTTTFVTWSKVTATGVEGVAFVELNSFVEQGASGGGVFVNGVHIANNWSRRTDRDAASGQVLRQYSVASINTGAVIAVALGATEIAAIGN